VCADAKNIVSMRAVAPEGTSYTWFDEVFA
jgi:hypothetical protein